MRQEPSARELAGRLLDHEAPGRAGAAELAGATDRICVRLHQEFARLVGDVGCDLLVTRALTRAAAAAAFLRGTRWQRGSATGLAGLRERLEARSPREARCGCAELVSAFLYLLFQFVGPDLTARQVQRAWPDLPPVRSSPEESQ
jgi:hypothetical protein